MCDTGALDGTPGVLIVNLPQLEISYKITFAIQKVSSKMCRPEWQVPSRIYKKGKKVAVSLSFSDLRHSECWTVLYHSYLKWKLHIFGD